MNETSMNLMREIVEKYKIGGATVVDVGSYDVNGTYKELFSGGKYIGVDIFPGPNVDVLMDSDEWNEIKNVDAVISGSTLEHVADIPKLMKSIYDVLKPGGLLCIIVPSQGPPHDYPIWVGNISEEQMTKIMVDSGFEVLESIVNDEEPWHLVRCVGRKKGEFELPQSFSTKVKPRPKMKISNVSLAIGIPCSFPMVPFAFFKSFVLAEKPSFQFITAENGPIDTLRNDIVAKAKQTRVTKLLIMDVDMVYHPKTIPQMLLRNLPILGALCFRRYPPFDSIMLRITDTGYESVNDWKEGELIDVDATGAGCMMYDMRIFYDMDKRAQAEIDAFNALRPTREEFSSMSESTRKYIEGLQDRCVHPREPGVYFKFKKNKKGMVIGEDVGFCQELQMAGHKIFVDTSVPSDHLTTIAINRNMNKLWENLKVKQLAVLDKAKALGKQKTI